MKTVQLLHDIHMGGYVGWRTCNFLCVISRNVLKELSIEIERINYIAPSGTVWDLLPEIQQDKMAELREELKDRYWSEMVPMLMSTGEVVA